MSKLIVKPSCCGCGLCIASCSYLKENDDGNAEYDISKPISENDLELVRKVVSQCPEKALELVVTENNYANRDENLRKIISNFKMNSEKIKVQKITRSTIPLEVYLRYPSSNKEYEEYSSKYAAKNAARDEINRLCRYDTAYIPMIREVFANYKVDKLKKYYTLSDTPQSIFYEYNQQVRKLLSGTYAEIIQCTGSSFAVPKKWLEFSVLPTDNTWYIDCLNVFEHRHTESVAKNFESRGKYTSVDWYMRHIEIGETCDFVSSGLFKRDRLKTLYYFHNFYEAVNEFVEDLKTSFSNKSYDIEEDAVNLVNGVLGEYEKAMRSQLNNRLDELKVYVKNFQQQNNSFVESTPSSKQAYTTQAQQSSVQNLVNVLSSVNVMESNAPNEALRFEVTVVYDHGNGEYVVYGRFTSGTIRIGQNVFVHGRYGSCYSAKVLKFKRSVGKCDCIVIKQSTYEYIYPEDVITDSIN